MASKKQRCRVCGDEGYVSGGVCRKAACVEYTYDRDLSGEVLERFFAKRAALRRKGLLPRPSLDPWERKGDPLQTPNFRRPA